MKNNNYLEELYLLSKESINSFTCDNINAQEDLLSILEDLKFNKNFVICDTNNYNLDEISKLFRFYENELKSSFLEDKIAFDIKFRCYLLLAELFTKLCTLFSYDREKRFLINSIFQILEESNNLLKLTIAFEKKEVQILNNLLGQQLYCYSHIQYIETKDKDIHYILEKFYLNLERIHHGYELSYDSNFGNDFLIKKDKEEMVFINNISFLLLKMLYKLDFYMPNLSYENNPYFIKIKSLFIEILKIETSNKIETILEFKKLLLWKFKKSSDYLENSCNTNVYNDKIKLLKLNTDEYKQLIDIILSLKL